MRPTWSRARSLPSSCRCQRSRRRSRRRRHCRRKGRACRWEGSAAAWRTTRRRSPGHDDRPSPQMFDAPRRWMPPCSLLQIGQVPPAEPSVELPSGRIRASTCSVSRHDASSCRPPRLACPSTATSAALSDVPGRSKIAAPSRSKEVSGSSAGSGRRDCRRHRLRSGRAIDPSQRCRRPGHTVAGDEVRDHLAAEADVGVEAAVGAVAHDATCCR